MADRRLPASLGSAVAGVALALALAPSDPLPLPIELRWLGAFALLVVLPGWLLLRLVRPACPGEESDWLESTVLVGAAGYSVAILLGLVLHALFRPIAPWQLAAGGGLLVVALALSRRGSTPQPLRGANIGYADVPPHCDGEGEQMRPEGGSMNCASTDATGVRAQFIAPLQFVAPLRGGAVLRRAWPALLVLVVAAPLRLADLGWSEFQGDEARVVLRALAALQGADGALAAHRKVPGEILLTYLFAGSLGQIQEQVARLPFALAGVGAALAFYLLAYRLLGRPAALVAGLLLAVNGYFVAFGRILQYDSLAFFLGICGLLCCWRFGQEARGERRGVSGEGRGVSGEGRAASEDDDLGRAVRWALLGALLLSGAALVALGAVFLVPPALLLAGPGLLRSWRSWRVLAAWGWPLVPLAVAAWLVLGADDPTDGPSGIWSYLGPRFGGERPYWHGLDFLVSANHYLSTPYLLTMLLGLGLVVLLGLVGLARTLDGRGAVIRLGLAVLVAWLSWDRPRVALVLGALLVLALALQAPTSRQRPSADGRRRALLARLVAPVLGRQLALRVALVWAAGPLFVHLFLIRVPGTHWREAFPGAVLAVALLAAPLLSGRRSRVVVLASIGILVVGAGQYAWATLIQRLPEYQLTYPANRHPLDWSNRDGRGIGGVFGIAHRHGWKALAVVRSDGALPGGYVTNESPAIAAWYLHEPQGCEDDLAYVFRVPRAPNDRNLAVPVPIPPGYQTRAVVRVNGRATIAMQMAPGSTTRSGDIAAEAYEARFDRELASVWRPVGELYRADLGAAAAKRACAAQPTVPRFR